MTDSYVIFTNTLFGEKTGFKYSEARRNPITIMVMENFTKKVKPHFGLG